VTIKTANAFTYTELRKNARELRHFDTPAEKVLWSHLRKQPLQVKFVRQHVIGTYIVDFFSYSQQLVIEVDGEYHQVPEQQEADHERESFLRKRGYRILRFTNEQVINQTKQVIQTIKDNLIINP